MNYMAQLLLQKLYTLEGSGQFATTDTVKFNYPGLHVEGVGELGFPLNPVQVKALIGVARKAPFGKGGQTITDSKVRSAWEIDASQWRFEGDEWTKTMAKIIKKAAKGLGLKAHDIVAEPYKLLVYEPGDFFLPHKDSEKAKGMFGTLVVGLPCDHEGGELHIRFGGKEVVADFSAQKGATRIPYAAFYADCEHEIRPLQTGYRVCLTFNLIKEGVAQPLNLSSIETEIEAIASILQQMKSYFKHRPKAVLLQHEYTPANFTPNHLKGEDSSRAQVVEAAANRAGFFTRLGLVTHYQMGDLEIDYDFYRRGRRGYSYYDDDIDPDDGEMGEVHEKYTKVEHWGESPGLGSILLENEDIIANISLGGGEPSEKAAEGFTGNAGMTMEYWYHYGAVVLWPKERHHDILAGAPLSVQLAWLAQYINNWNKCTEEERQHTRAQLENMLDSAPKPEKQTYYSFGSNFTDFEESEREAGFVYTKENYSPVALGLVCLDDAEWVAARAGKLSKVAPCINISAWAALLARYGAAPFIPALQSLMEVHSEGNIAHLLKLLVYLDAEQQLELRQLIVDFGAEMPRYLPQSKFTHPDFAKDILLSLLALSPSMPDDWSQGVADVLTLNAPRNYVNKYMVPAVQLAPQQGSTLQILLRKFCIQDLNRRIAEKPEPPTDWTRQVPPQAANSKGLWAILKPFMESPTASAYDYAAREDNRREMERIVRNAKLDLDMETISRGRPYTLRLRKNMASFNQRYSDWKEDVELLANAF